MSSSFIEFGSEDWLKQLQTELNKSQAYAEAAKNWEGDIYFVIEAAGSSLTHDIYMYLDLWHGHCRSVAVASTQDQFKPEFIIKGTVKAFKEVVNDGLDPIKAMLTRKLKLSGNMAKIMRNVKAANQLVVCCTLIPTHFPLE